MEPVALGSRYRPETTWVGFHIPPQYPYADIYPVSSEEMWRAPMECPSRTRLRQAISLKLDRHSRCHGATAPRKRACKKLDRRF